MLKKAKTKLPKFVMSRAIRTEFSEKNSFKKMAFKSGKTMARVRYFDFYGPPKNALSSFPQK
jgi:hypothetical protein